MVLTVSFPLNKDLMPSFSTLVGECVVQTHVTDTAAATMDLECVWGSRGAA